MKIEKTAWRRSYIEGDLNYCPIRGLGEKPSPLGEDFSMLAAWEITVNPATQYMILSTILYG